MNKTSKLFMGVASLAMLAACSDDAPVMDGGNGGNVLPGDGTTAYMSVVLSAPADFSRSTDFENGDGVDGALVPGSEHDITSAKFFFFDENGNFVLNAKLTNPSFGDSSQKPNIEWESKSNILVLEDLKSNQFPRYMLTVLNMPEFQAESTLQATAEKLTAENYHAEYYTTEDNDKVSNFVMTTSSYKRTSSYDNTSLTADSKYAVNELKASDFQVTPTEAMNTANAVVVYVERLAAKVEVDLNVANKKNYTDANNVEHTIYKLDQTVAGDENDNNTGGDTAPTANADLYVEVLGWSLNATANQSNMSKQLKTAWFTTQPFAAWENALNYRSYWAYSYPYSLGSDVTALENALNYVNYTDINANALKPGLGSNYPQYCFENTNDPDNILKYNPTTRKNEVYNSRVTHVVLNTRLCDAEGNDVSALRFRGTLFTESHLKNYALNALKNGGKLNYWVSANGVTTPEVDNPAHFTQVNVDAIGFEGVEGTMAKAVFKYIGTGKLYKRTESEGKVTYVAYDDASELEAALNDLANNLDIEWYNTRNIYYIPVEHNAPVGSNNNVEGYYGVVRNHWYKIEINSFSKVGHGIYDPDDDTIIVKPGDPEDTFYYLGARINVLSWRVIKQNVDL